MKWTIARRCIYAATIVCNLLAFAGAGHDVRNLIIAVLFALVGWWEHLTDKANERADALRELVDDLIKAKP